MVSVFSGILRKKSGIGRQDVSTFARQNADLGFEGVDFLRLQLNKRAETIELFDTVLAWTGQFIGLEKIERYAFVSLSS